MAYDTLRNELIVFGGTQDFAGDTWRRSSAGWTATSSPLLGLRIGSSMAYDSARQRAVLFGGVRVGGGVSNDLFEWDGSAWTQRQAPGPAAQDYAGMAYDSGRSRTVLFGGPFAQSMSGETWEWDGTAWQFRGRTGPRSRFGTALAYDSLRQRTVLFGGNVDPEAFAGTNDTWEWDGSRWQLMATSGPPARGYAAMAFSLATGKTVLFGGTTSTSIYADLADTWEWDGTAWTQRSGSNVPGRSRHVMAWDAARQRVVLFGGQTAAGPSSELWSWDGSAWSLVDGGPASSYVVSTLAYDETRREVLYYGGTEPRTLVALGETWTWNGATWRRHTPATSPPPRHAPALCFDPLRQRVLLVGGPIGDHWEWDGTTWQQQQPAQVPGARFGAVMAFDPGRRRVVLFGGLSSSSLYMNDTWEWDGTAWSRMTPPVSPPARSHAHLAWDPNTRKVLLFGGVRDGPTALGDTWAFDGVTWEQLTPNTRPLARLNGALLTDLARGRCVLAGGSGYSVSLTYELWDWDGADWSRRLSEPSLRTQAYAALDAARGHIVVLEGNFSSSFVELAYPVDVVGRGNARLLADTAALGGALRLDIATAASSLLLLAGGYPRTPPLVFTGGVLCGSEPLFLPGTAWVGVPFVGPRISLPVPNDPALAYAPILVQAAVAMPASCVALTDAVAVRIQPQ